MVALQNHASQADKSGVCTREDPVCEICGQPVGGTGGARPMIVVIMTSQDQEFIRHRRCHMLELLERA
jgi:hypothetical protein